ncbi:MAG: glutamate-cysteine ligase family protein [bacterium]|jgi:carboxylate-amine ligase|nr:glutamate-cysteine ligase family protein [bacterium]
MTSAPLHLFDAYGVELEYMIVAQDTLAVRPIADQLIQAAHGTVVNEIERGEICWSNELVAHVIELKTNGPAPTLDGLADRFLENIQAINAYLQPFHARLMPTAMHPWMDPHTETRLWPYDYNIIYETYHRIFDCRGHGWSNLQSIHINLPFADDTEFNRLHAAIRLVLPLLPALAASSPVVGSACTGSLDNRMVFYRNNSVRIPSVAGVVVPETVSSQREYVEKILQPMYEEIAPYDPDGVLQDEWLNSRGAIARFDRQAIEIRVLDIQENPYADLAIVALVVAVVKHLTEERWADLDAMKAYPLPELESVFLATIAQAEHAVLADPTYLRLFGYAGKSCTAGELWKALMVSCHDCLPTQPRIQAFYSLYQEQGSLAQRILKRLQPAFTHAAIETLYRELCDCLHDGVHFRA